MPNILIESPIMPIHTSRLDDLVRDVHAAGGLNNRAVVEKYLPFDVAFDTIVDQTLDPFSEAYVAQQVALYREIAGRDLDQAKGELHAINIAPYLRTPNPLGTYDSSNVAEQMRGLAATLALACLGERPKILDLGAGGGLSSEIYAYAGCDVHAVDIDPLLGKMARERAARFGFDIARSELNFDDVASLSGQYQGAFFFQAFHHCLRPWKLIEDLAALLADDGVIGFNGEPMQTAWWKHWGLRLDIESVFVARANGWMESGWSHDFIRRCFARQGFHLLFFSGGFRSDIGIASRDLGRIKAIRDRAAAMDLVERAGGLDVSDGRYLSATGERIRLDARPGFKQIAPGPGALMFGPYMSFEPGTYDIEVVVELQAEYGRDGALLIDITADHGRTVLFAQTCPANSIDRRLRFHHRLSLTGPATAVEIRAQSLGGAMWTVTLPEIRKLA